MYEADEHATVCYSIVEIEGFSAFELCPTSPGAAASSSNRLLLPHVVVDVLLQDPTVPLILPAADSTLAPERYADRKEILFVFDLGWLGPERCLEIMISRASLSSPFNCPFPSRFCLFFLL